MAINKKLQIDKAYHSSGLSNSNKLSDLEEGFLCPKYVIKVCPKGTDICSNMAIYYNHEELMGAMLNYTSTHDVIV